MFARVCHTRRVRLSASLIQRIALIVLLAFTGARLTDAHLHVCLDGQEPPVTLHAGDRSDHDDGDHQKQEHDDRDVDVPDAIFVKKAAPDVPFINAFALVRIAIAPPRFSDSVPPQLTPPYRPSFQLRPPLRGPPLESVLPV
jgi:hypothetical protein